jgi:hypothetical protein
VKCFRSRIATIGIAGLVALAPTTGSAAALPLPDPTDVLAPHVRAGLPAEAAVLAGVTGDRPALVGLLLYLLVAVGPTVVLWFALRVLPAAGRVVGARRRREAAPAGPPLESLVADLRRLRRHLTGPPPRNKVRRAALVAAYDDVLLDVCRAVGVDVPPLADATGAERAFARLQAEAGVEAAGIALDPPRDDGSAAA